MPFYGNKRRVDEFDYRDVHVEIFQALMGATHCDLEHEPEKRRCDACGQPIRPIRVHVITAFGNEIEVLINVTPQAARRIAERMIDDVIDRHPGGDDPLTDRPNGPGDEDKPADPGDFLIPPDEPDQGGNGRGRGERPLAPSNRLARIADRMKKLGWPLKAANIIREERQKRAP